MVECHGIDNEKYDIDKVKKKIVVGDMRIQRYRENVKQQQQRRAQKLVFLDKIASKFNYRRRSIKHSSNDIIIFVL